MMPLDLSALLEPFGAEAPAGIDLRTDASANSLYFQLKDARAQARMAERSSEAAGEPPHVPPAWQIVRKLAIEALQSQTKDIEIAAWLLEAQVRLFGFPGLTDGFNLIRGLVDTYWPSLHSIDEDDAAGKLSPLAGLNGIDGEGALVQPIRMVSLLPDFPYGAHALWHVARALREPEGPFARDFHAAKASIGIDVIRAHARAASAARNAFAAMTGGLDATCGDASPPSSHIRNTLDEVFDCYRVLLGDGFQHDAIADAAPMPSPAAGAPSSGPARAPRIRELATREDAFSELLRVADFFRHNEPHSPLSYALETLVRRGRMSFLDLLEELVPDQNNRRQLLQHAGIRADAEKDRR